MALFPEGVSGEYLGDGRARISTVVAGSGEVRVDWEVSRHRNFRTWVSHGIVIATQANDYRVSVEVDELHEGTRYFYRFKTSGEYSPQADFRF